MPGQGQPGQPGKGEPGEGQPGSPLNAQALKDLASALGPKQEASGGNNQGEAVPQARPTLTVAENKVDISKPKEAETAVQAEEEEEEDYEDAEDYMGDEIEDFFSAYSEHSYGEGFAPKAKHSQFFSFAGYFGGDDLTDFRTASDFEAMEAEGLDEAVMKAREMVDTVGTINSGHGNVPIKPMGTPERKAASVAQAMIERMSTIEDDEKRQQDEFKYDAKRIMKLQINPMRGLQSAKVGRTKAPVCIFIDYSGSCSHVSDLFGLILVGFANEGATVLIGGNGVVNAVYHPFPNRPLEHYAHDMEHIAVFDIEEGARVKAGFLVKCPGANLQDLSVGPMIACTDFDSYDALMARPRNSTHVIFAYQEPHHSNLRSVMVQGRVDFGTDLRTWHSRYASQNQVKTGVGFYSKAQNLSFHQIVHPVKDLETLTEMLRASS